MRYRARTAGSVDVTDEQRGIRIQERRLALGINSVRRLAKASGLARATVTNAEAGRAAKGTYLVLEALLDRLEAGEPLPSDEPEGAEVGVQLLEVEGETVRVVAHLSADLSPEELQARVTAIIQGIKNGEA
jgi:transcriptional regulator with XRE-family HTH domain